MRDDPTTILNAATGGNPSAAARLIPLVYDELRRLADRYRGGGAPADAIGATALVHEAYLKLIQSCAVVPEGRDHFIAVAATAMRQILVDDARTRRALRHGGGRRRIAVDDAELVQPDRASTMLDLLALDEAMHGLASLDPRQCRVVELRVFGGMTAQQVAAVLGVSKTTVDSDWRAGCAWLHARMSRRPSC